MTCSPSGAGGAIKEPKAKAREARMRGLGHITNGRAPEVRQKFRRSFGAKSIFVDGSRGCVRASLTLTPGYLMNAPAALRERVMRDRTPAALRERGVRQPGGAAK